jgi:maltose alpha-D-glucosyltransferase/alpha-amylase
MIALRKLFRVFGRGTMEFLNPSNRKVLAYVRRHEDELVLCVANLSRFAQPVDLELRGLDGMIPVEMLGYVEFPPIGPQPYRLTLSPYAFLWLELHGKPEPEVPCVGTDLAPLAADTWECLLEGVSQDRLETIVLPEYLPKQRWFGGKARPIRKTKVVDWTRLADSPLVLALVDVQYERGDPDTYFLTLGMSFDADAEKLRQAAPNSILSSVISHEGFGVLHDGMLDDSACAALLTLVATAGQLSCRHGSIRGVPSTKFAAMRESAAVPLVVHWSSAEQSNTSILYGDRFILKLFRRQQPGPNPDYEIGRYLTEVAHFDGVPPLAGAIEYVAAEGESSTLAMLQGLVANEGDGWKLTLEELDRYFENCAPVSFPSEVETPEDVISLSEHDPTQLARDHVGIALDSAARLGRRTAELHLALARPRDNPTFSPEPLTVHDLQTLASELRRNATRVFDLLKESMAQLPDETLDLAGLVLGRRRQLLESFGLLGQESLQAQRIRVHGDYHLGQVLRVKTDHVILDFEGEPARPMAQRRAKQSPLKDVAGMLRSFGYAAYAGLITYTARRPEDLDRLESWARLWERSASAEFLRAYRETTEGAAFLPRVADDFRKLLAAYLLDKALYELSYELNNRPAWVRIPLTGILSLPLEARGR